MLGMWKDELAGFPMKEFIGIKLMLTYKIMGKLIKELRVERDVSQKNILNSMTIKIVW